MKAEQGSLFSFLSNSICVAVAWLYEQYNNSTINTQTEQKNKYMYFT